MMRKLEKILGEHSVKHEHRIIDTYEGDTRILYQTFSDGLVKIPCISVTKYMSKQSRVTCPLDNIQGLAYGYCNGRLQVVSKDMRGSKLYAKRGNNSWKILSPAVSFPKSVQVSYLTLREEFCWGVSSVD